MELIIVGVDLAEQLIRAAAKAGVDIVKFQTFSASDLVLKSTSKANYQLKNSDEKESQFKMLEKLELNEEEHHQLIKHCKKRNIKFLSTGFDLKGFRVLPIILKFAIL